MSICCGADATVFGHNRDCHTLPPVITPPRPLPPEIADAIERYHGGATEAEGYRDEKWRDAAS